VDGLHTAVSEGCRSLGSTSGEKDAVTGTGGAAAETADGDKHNAHEAAVPAVGGGGGVTSDTPTKHASGSYPDCGANESPFLALCPFRLEPPHTTGASGACSAGAGAAVRTIAAASGAVPALVAESTPPTQQPQPQPPQQDATGRSSAPSSSSSSGPLPLSLVAQACGEVVLNLTWRRTLAAGTPVPAARTAAGIDPLHGAALPNDWSPGETGWALTPRLRTAQRINKP
jgi:hypothetical protein